MKITEAELYKIDRICLEIENFAGARREENRGFAAWMRRWYPNEIVRNEISTNEQQKDNAN